MRTSLLLFHFSVRSIITDLTKDICFMRYTFFFRKASSLTIKILFSPFPSQYQYCSIHQPSRHYQLSCPDSSSFLVDCINILAFEHYRSDLLAGNLKQNTNCIPTASCLCQVTDCVSNGRKSISQLFFMLSQEQPRGPNPWRQPALTPISGTF